MNASRLSSVPWSKLGLPALLLYLGAWGVWAIALDRHPEYSDTMLFDALKLWRAFTDPHHGLSSLAAPSYHPPLCFLPGVLLFLITGPGLTVMRLTVLLQYLASVWLAYDIGRGVAGRHAGLVSAVLLGTFPLIFGWGRMAYMDMGFALMVLVALRLVRGCDFGTHRGGVALGLGLGLGMLSKIAFPLFAAAPVLWALLTRIRRRRHLAVLATAMVTALVVCGWWYLLQWRTILINVEMSSGGPAAKGPLATLHELTFKVDGGVWLLALALGGSLAAWRLRTVPARELVLLSLGLWPSFALLLFFHPLRRYALPVYCVAAILAGVSLQTTLERLGSRLSRAATAGLAVFLLGHFTWLNLGQPVDEPPLISAASGFRVDDLGLIYPDRRAFDSFPGALRAMEKRFKTCLVVFAGPGHHEKHLSRDLRLRLEQGNPRVRLIWRRGELDTPSGPVCALLVTDTGGENHWREEPQNEGNYFESCMSYGWFEAQKVKRLLGSWGPSPIGLRYRLYEVPDAPSATAPRPDYCKKVFNVGDGL